MQRRIECAICFRRFWSLLTASAVALGLAACAKQAPPPPKTPLWPTLPLQQVQDFMKGTLFERVRFSGLEETPIFGYSLVVNLHDTGDSNAPGVVRDYIIKQMLLRGFESSVAGTQNMSPGDMLRDKRIAIVAVEGLLPVGGRSGQTFDVFVRCLPHNSTKSLAHGELYQTDLSDIGLVDPNGIQSRLQANVPGGPIFVNPTYALVNGATTRPDLRNALRLGVVLNGGVVRFDRPISLQLRQPQASTARMIESIVSERWQGSMLGGMVHSGNDDVVAKAENEGLVLIYVPEQYKGDWKHFLGVVSHLYLNQSSEFLTAKARELVEKAHQPNAPLVDISLCWEAMGEEEMPTFEPLIADPDPDVAFAAARAAAFLGDAPAQRALVDMALDPSQHNQLEAVRVLGELPDSPEVDHMISQLLDSDRSDVRIEAYKLLASSSEEDIARPDDTDTNVTRHYGVLTYDIGHRFLLDIVPSKGKPMVFASTTGVPRIAIFGHLLTLRTPVTFTAMDMRFSLSSSDGTQLLTMFYRDPLSPDPVKADTHNDLPEILARLGGEGPDDNQQHFDFSFGDVVAMARQLVTSHAVVGRSLTDNGEQECVFELEHPRMGTDAWTSIPSENREGRPQGDGAVTGQSNTASVEPSARAGG